MSLKDELSPGVLYVTHFTSAYAHFKRRGVFMIVSNDRNAGVLTILTKGSVSRISTSMFLSHRGNDDFQLCATCS